MPPDKDPRNRWLKRAWSQRGGTLAGAVALVIDQATKPLAHAYVEQHGPTDITSFLTMMSGWNTGVAFGLAAFANPWVLIAVGLGLSAFLAILLVRAQSAVERIALGMAIGGALSNVIDRARFGAVRDFIAFHWSGWQWPAFNFADAFIVVGLCSLLFIGREERGNCSGLTREGEEKAIKR